MKKKRNTKSASKLVDIVIGIVCVSGIAVSLGLFIKEWNKSSISETKEPVAVVVQKKNTTQKRFSDEEIWQRVKVSDLVYDGDRIRTDVESEATIIFNDGETTIDLYENTLVTIRGTESSRGIDFAKGSVNILSAASTEEKPVVVTNGNKVLNLKGTSSVVVESSKKGEASVAVTSGSVDVKEKPVVQEKKTVAKRVASAVASVRETSEEPVQLEIISKTISAGEVAVIQEEKPVQAVETVSFEKAETQEKTKAVVKKVRSSSVKSEEKQKEIQKAFTAVMGKEKADEITEKVKEVNDTVQKVQPEKVRKVTLENDKKVQEQQHKVEIATEEKAYTQEKARKAEELRKAQEEKRLREERIAREKAEQKRREELAAKREAERKAETERKRREELAAKREAERKAEAERIEAERKAAEEKRARELAARKEAERKEKERITREKAEQKRREELAAKQEAERIEAERKAAEEKRIAEEKAAREAEEARRAEEERIAREAEEARKAEEARIARELAARKEAELRRREQERIEKERIAAEKAAEAARIEAERKAEEKRLAEEKRIAEEKAAREAEEVRKAEEKRIAEEKAEQKRREELAARQAEIARLAKEAREAEKARKAEEERKKAEEIRVAEEKARAEKEALEAEKIRKAQEDQEIRKAEEARKSREIAEAAEKEQKKTEQEKKPEPKKIEPQKAEVKITGKRPVLKTPSSNLVISEDFFVDDNASIRFTWGKMADAKKYRLVIYRDGLLDKKIVDKTLKGNAYTLKSNELEKLDNGTYVWWVQGIDVVDGKDYESKKAESRFTVNVDDAGAVELDVSDFLH